MHRSFRGKQCEPPVVYSGMAQGRVAVNVPDILSSLSGQRFVLPRDDVERRCA